MALIKPTYMRNIQQIERSSTSLSGRVLDSRSNRGWGFKPHQRYCVGSLSKTLYPLLSTGSTQENVSCHMTEKFKYSTGIKRVKFLPTSDHFGCQTVWTKGPA